MCSTCRLYWFPVSLDQTRGSCGVSSLCSCLYCSCFYCSFHQIMPVSPALSVVLARFLSCMACRVRFCRVEKWYHDVESSRTLSVGLWKWKGRMPYSVLPSRHMLHLMHLISFLLDQPRVILLRHAHPLKLLATPSPLCFSLFQFLFYVAFHGPYAGVGLLSQNLEVVMPRAGCCSLA